MSFPLNQQRGLLKGCALLAFLAISGASLAAPPKKNEASPLPAFINTNEIVVQMTSGAFADALARKHNVAVKGTLREQPDWVIFSAPDVATALAVEAKLKSDPLVIMVGNNRLTKREKFQAAYVPNDPYLFFNNPAGTPGQWHLSPNASGKPAANCQAAWTQGMTGLGVTIGIVDDGLEHAHPDLAPAYLAAQSFDFGQNDADPTPLAGEFHGTAVAGVAGARGGNAIGGSGAAPKANLAGMRIDFSVNTDADLANAVLYRSSGAPSNRTVQVKNHSYGIPAPYVPNAVELAGYVTSAGAGTIHVVAAGNSRGATDEDSNKMMVQNNTNVICVAALGGDAKFATYSNYGACVFVTAPSNTFAPGQPGITTTDRMGNTGYNDAGNDPFPDDNYTSQFGGTSSASPLVAGVMALLKERCRAADGRLAKHLLARTSKVVDPFDVTPTSDGGWKTNDAGLRFNSNYGFGNIHAGDLVALGRNFYSSSPRVVRTFGPTAVNAVIPDGNTTGLTRLVSSPAVPGSPPIEDVTLRLRATHTWRGDITAEITSPAGTTQRVVSLSNDGEDNLDWTFTCNAFWGERSTGVWRIRVWDPITPDQGTWTDFTLTLNLGTTCSRLGSNILSYQATDATQLQFNALNRFVLNTVPTSQSYANQSLAWVGAAGTFVPVAAGDVDGDGRNDVLYQNSALNGQFGLIPYVGYTPLTPAAILGLSAGFRVFGIADVNRNGVNDYVMHNPTTGQIGFQQCNGTSVAGAYVNITTAPAGTIPFGAADCTGDGQVDILVDKTTAARAVWILQLTGGGASPVVHFGTLFSGFQVTGYTLLNIGDLNYDNQPDLIARRDSNPLEIAGYTMNVNTVTTVQTVCTIPAGHVAVGAAAL